MMRGVPYLGGEICVGGFGSSLELALDPASSLESKAH